MAGFRLELSFEYGSQSQFIVTYFSFQNILRKTKRFAQQLGKQVCGEEGGIFYIAANIRAEKCGSAEQCWIPSGAERKCAGYNCVRAP